MEKMKFHFSSGTDVSVSVTKENKKKILDIVDYDKLLTIDNKIVIFLNKVDFILCEEE